MSINIVETLLDNLLFPGQSGKEIPLPRNSSAAQNLMGTNSRMNSNILSEFHQLLKSECYPPDAIDMNISNGMKNKFQNYDTDHSLVSKVPKLFSPSFPTLQDLHLLSNQAELHFGTEFSNPRGSILNETLDQLEVLKNEYNMKPQPTAKMPENSVNLSSAQETMCVKPADVVQDSATVNSTSDDTLLKSQKLSNNCHTLNQELVNRKAKELNKRSKKRRRRQKKNKKNSKQEHAVENSKKPMSNNESTTSQPSQSSVSESPSVNCDIVSFTGRANEVQIILPSFVISVESGDDDTDWDACSDNECITECAEFELSGLFVANLTAPKISNCPVKKLVSHLDIPSSHEEKELRKFRNMLLCVNKTWNEATKDLERKQKLPSKVSFAPEDELVQVFQVDNYERKGEWETYALERIRFKKRIDELECILMPCLSKEHRAKVFHKMYKTNS